jgi:acetyl-CoA carboxylase carboxyl transferase subunit beta
LRLPIAARIEQLFEPQSFELCEGQGEQTSAGLDLDVVDPLAFREAASSKSDHPRRYRDYVKNARRSTGRSEALVVGTAALNTHRLVFAAVEPEFVDGTLGLAETRKLLEAFALARRTRKPLLVCVAGAGARVQEGARSNVLLAPCMVARSALAKESVPLVSLICDPCLGPLAALSATADLVLAEPGARVGYSGGQTPLSAEQALEQGLIDQVVTRPEQKRAIGRFFQVVCAHQANAR